MYQMKVREKYYTMLRDGIKTIELRLYDEKRQKIKIGELIEFSCVENPSEKFVAKVKALYRADDFQRLSTIIDIKKAGFFGDTDEMLRIMEEFYPRENQQKYGVLGIEIQKL